MRRRALEKRIVWIFGSPRSGSTWLLQLLAEHDRVVPINEPNIGLHLGPFVSDHPATQAADLDLSNFTYNRLGSEVSQYFFSRRYSNVWEPALRDLIVRRMAVHGDRRKLIVCQEPNGSQAADVILRVLPRSRLLFLLRDGRDVVDSELAAFSTGSWMSKRVEQFRGIGPGSRAGFIDQSARKWVWRTEVVREAFEEHPGPKLLLRYEELLAQTLRELTRAMEWLGLDTGGVGRVVEKHSFAHADSGPQKFARAAQPGLWRDNLSSEEQMLITGIMGPTLGRMGYPVE